MTLNKQCSIKILHYTMAKRTYSQYRKKNTYMDGIGIVHSVPELVFL